MAALARKLGASIVGHRSRNLWQMRAWHALAKGRDVGWVGQCLGSGDESRDVIVADRAGLQLVSQTGRNSAVASAIISGAGSAHQIVVEIIAMEGQDDFIRNVGPVQPVRQGSGSPTPGVARISIDGDARRAVGPAKTRQPIGRKGRPDRRAEQSVCRNRCLDAFGHAKVAVVRHGIETHCSVRDRTQHLLARRGLGAAVIEKKCPMDARCPITVREPRHCDQARPTALGLEISKVRMEHQIRRCRIR